MARFSRKQIIAIILKKKGLLSGFFSGPKTPEMGIHKVFGESKVNRFLRAYMSSAPIESKVYNPHHGVYPSWVVTLKGGQKAIFKADYAASEHMAYVVDRVMGFNRVLVVVPRTISINGVTQTGVLMQWSKSGRPAKTLFTQSNQRVFSSSQAREFDEMPVFDYIIGNMDRHAGNYLFKGSQIIPIDHGLSFQRSASTPALMFMNKKVSTNVYRLPLESRKSLLLQVDRLLRSEKRLKKMQYAGGDSPTINEHRISEVMKRTRFLKRYIKSHKLDTDNPVTPRYTEERELSFLGRGGVSIKTSRMRINTKEAQRFRSS